MKKEERREIKAWVATATQAEKINDADVRRLEEYLGNKLNIVHAKNGDLTIYPSDKKARNKFNRMMRAARLFNEQKIYVDSNSKKID